MNPSKLKRIFPNASRTFKLLNSDPVLPPESKQMDTKQICENMGSETMGEANRHCFIQVEFFAGHGQALDEDNRRYIVKPILDAFVNLGFSKTDKYFKSEVTQRMDEADLHI